MFEPIPSTKSQQKTGGRIECHYFSVFNANARRACKDNANKAACAISDKVKNIASGNAYNFDYALKKLIVHIIFKQSLSFTVYFKTQWAPYPTD